MFKGNKIFIILGVLIVGAIIWQLFTMESGSDLYKPERKSEKEKQEEPKYVEKQTEIETPPKNLTEIEQPNNPWKNATGIAYWYVWFTKGEGQTMNSTFKTPTSSFNYKMFKEKHGKDAFVLDYLRVHRETVIGDTTATGEWSHWFIVADSKESEYQFNSHVKFPHKHFSMARAKAEFEEDVFIQTVRQLN
ncbi:MAG: hypothetical protein R3182_12980 [Draconibacterium sp.]|nr:hypothetical protein [Draconibacterium sp.]